MCTQHQQSQGSPCHWVKVVHHRCSHHGITRGQKLRWRGDPGWWGQRLEGQQCFTQTVTRTVRGTGGCTSPPPPEVKVLPKVDPCSLGPAVEEINVGLRDEVLLLSLDFHVARILSFISIRSASVALKSFNKSKQRAS